MSSPKSNEYSTPSTLAPSLYFLEINLLLISYVDSILAGLCVVSVFVSLLTFPTSL